LKALQGPIRVAEEWVACAALLLMASLPLLEAVLRSTTGSGIPGSLPIVQHLTLWVTFLGAALAAREGKLLALATGELMPEGKWRSAAKIFSAAVASCVSIMLGKAAFDLLVIERDAGTVFALDVPVWVALLVMPLGFGVIALRLVWRSSDGWSGRAIAAIGLLVGLLLSLNPSWLEGSPKWPWLLLLVLATVLGGPIFAILGGAAVFLFLIEGVPAAAVPVETYRLTVDATLPAIPLFTLAGFLLAQGGTSKRLLRVFRAFLGWLPGGTAVVAAVSCAFFTVLTGGSGVTILALGGLLFQALRGDKYRERFSLGLLTASGSLGILFPPALPLILYAIVADISIPDLFVGSMLPGVLLLALVAAWGIREGRLTGAGRQRFTWSELVGAVWEGKWELLLPVVVLVAIFGGFATIIEAAALTALYAFLVQFVIVRDVSIVKDLRPILTESLVLVGGVLIILAVALGFTNYLVDAQIASSIVHWVQAYIQSPLTFLLCLNLILLVVGCLMDIFSAIMVVVPLIVPLGAAYGIDPIHLGVIFVANLELGYLTPPVGLNLFLAAYRFERPLLQIWRAAIPMLVILAIGVLAITYVPALSLGLLELLGRH